MLSLLIAAALQLIPPSPPGLRLPAPLSPKASETLSSWGQPMSKATLPATLPKLIGGFIITNISVVGGQVTLQWSDGVAPFQIEAEPSLDGPWNDIGNLTMAHQAIFPVDQNRFFRVLQNQPIPFSITHTNPQNLEWETPTLDMGDTLSNFIVRRIPRTSETSVIPPVSTDPGWQECPSGISPCPVSPTPVPSNGLYTATDTTNPSNNPIWGYWYDIKETTANGVTVPYNPVAASPNNNVAPGTLQFVKLITSQSSGGQAEIHQVAVDTVGNIIACGYFGGIGFNFGDGNLHTAVLHDAFLIKYTPSGAIAAGFPIIMSTIKVGGGIGDNLSFGVTTDSANNIIWTGGFSGQFNFGGGVRTAGAGTGNKAIFIVKYSPLGAYVWDLTFGGTSSNDVGYSVAVDSSDNVVMGALLKSTDSIDFGGGPLARIGVNDLAICKFLANKNYVWANRVGSYPAENHLGQLAVDTLGRVVVTGFFQNSFNFKGTVDVTDHIKIGTAFGSIFVVQYNGSDGSFSWVNDYGFTAPDGSPRICAGNGIAIDKSNNDVLATGTFTGTINFGGGNRSALQLCQQSTLGWPGCAQAVFVLRLHSNGSHVWSNAYGGNSTVENYVDEGWGMAVNGSGEIALSINFRSGYMLLDTYNLFGTPSVNPSGIVVGLNSSGNAIWKPNQLLPVTRAYSAAFDPVSGRIVIGGYCPGISNMDFGDGNPVNTGSAAAAFVAVYTP